MTPCAILRIREDDSHEFYHCGDVVFLCIDERVGEEERVYMFTEPTSEADIKKLIGDSKIAHMNDSSGNTGKLIAALRLEGDDE